MFLRWGNYGLWLGPEITHSLETASFSTNNFEFRPPAVRAQQAGYSNDCRGMSCSRPVGWVHASGSMALQPPDSHSGCCTSSIWGAEPHQNPFKARGEILQVPPPTQPASCICPMPSHCIFRSALSELLTVCRRDAICGHLAPVERPGDGSGAGPGPGRSQVSFAPACRSLWPASAHLCRWLGLFAGAVGAV